MMKVAALHQVWVLWEKTVQAQVPVLLCDLTLHLEISFQEALVAGLNVNSAIQNWAKRSSMGVRFEMVDNIVKHMEETVVGTQA